MARWRLGGPVLAAALALVLAADPAAACPRPQGWTGGANIAGELWTAWWRPEPAPIPVGAHFSVRFHLCGPPVGRVGVRGWMPDHRHGMNYRPAVTLDGLSGTAEGLLFHMPGRWQLILDVRGASGREKLTGETAPAFDFTAREKRRILRHGPWPPASKPDPSNRVSGKPAAIGFGRALFFDPRLSLSGAVSCATCHQPDRAWTDGLPRSRGHRTVDRNALSLFNLRFNRWFGWDGAQDTLWAQNLRPLLDRREMGVGPGGAARLARSDRQLSCGYRRAFGAAPSADDERVFVDLGKALAAFLETRVTGRTPFDDFRDALARGDATGMARYPAAARRGLRLFVGRGNCSFCHFGPAFTNGEFADAGVPHFVEPGRVDPGRHGGIRELRRSPYTLLGRFNDDAERSTAARTRYVRLRQSNFGEFRVPGLRNVALTAPYMHAGSLETLAGVALHYSTLDEERLHAGGERILRRLDLSARKRADLVAFLETLTEKGPLHESAKKTGIALCR